MRGNANSVLSRECAAITLRGNQKAVSARRIKQPGKRLLH
ncbi:MAG: hypothetical protein J7559_04140 [Cohnella sp.]|nr:hypothetical protein [Cohnella sp.]